MKIALIGNNKFDITVFARYLVLNHNFTKMDMVDGARKVIRSLYFYKGHRALSWDMQYNFYDALYKIDPLVWIKFLDYRLSKTDKDVVVTGLRYSNEAKLLNERGFILIRISSAQKGTIARSLGNKRHGQDPADGTLLLQETFNAKAAPYKISYSIYNDSREDTKVALDKIIGGIKG